MRIEVETESGLIRIVGVERVIGENGMLVVIGDAERVIAAFQKDHWFSWRKQKTRRNGSGEPTTPPRNNARS